MINFIHRRLLPGVGILVFLAAIILSIFIYRLNLPAGKTGNFTVDIKRGMTAGEIAELLENMDVIRSSRYFRVISELKGYSRQFKAGKHKFDGFLKITELASLLTKNPPRPDIKVTVIEGLTINETASALSAQAGIDSAVFVAYAANKCIAMKLGVDKDTLEGYLYPDTYFIRQDSTPEEIIVRMVNRFHAVFNDLIIERAMEIGMTVHEVVTLASLIETEARIDMERPIISQVFHRRLKLKRPLEANPTIQYALGCKQRILEEDLKIQSPYNTYIHPGLPPGPIASPGEQSILAALYPADTHFLYFVSNGEGGHVFSHSLSEHNKAVRQYKRLRKQSAFR